MQELGRMLSFSKNNNTIPRQIAETINYLCNTLSRMQAFWNSV